MYPRIRTLYLLRKGLNGFAGYKAGMTHVIVTDNTNSHTKGEDVFFPVTVIECPPLKIFGIRFYHQTYDGLNVASEYVVKTDKNLARALRLPAKETPQQLQDAEAKLSSYSDVRILAHTQPWLVGLKKTPEILEMGVGGSIQEKFAFAKEKLGKDVKIDEVLKEGQQLDFYGVTKGKGFQGPVKRFGVSLRGHKSEKGRRGPGNLGPWTGNRSWTVAHAGQMGFHNRLERNKLLLQVGAEGITPSGGFLHYGTVKSTYILVKGSVQGTAKRLVRFNIAARPSTKPSTQAPAIQFVSLESKQ